MIGSLSGAFIAGVFAVLQTWMTNRKERAALESQERRERDAGREATRRERLKIAYEAAVLDHKDAWAIVRSNTAPKRFKAYPFAHYLATYVRLLESDMTPEDFNRILSEAKRRRMLVRHKGSQND